MLCAACAPAALCDAVAASRLVLVATGNAHEKACTWPSATWAPVASSCTLPHNSSRTNGPGQHACAEGARGNSSALQRLPRDITTQEKPCALSLSCKWPIASHLDRDAELPGSRGGTRRCYVPRSYACPGEAYVPPKGLLYDCHVWPPIGTH